MTTPHMKKGKSSFRETHCPAGLSRTGFLGQWEKNTVSWFS